MGRVVILGGGFAGTRAAKLLENDFDVTLLDTKDYFEFTPGILRVAVEPEYISKLQAPYSRYLKKTRIVKGVVREVSKNFVNVRGNKIPFDYLIISSGIKYELEIKTRNMIIPSGAEDLKNCSERLKKSKDILIIGGGLIGVELAAEIITKYKDKKIKIVHSGENLISRNHKKTMRYAEKFLVEKGVDIIFNERVSKDKKISKADIIFLCTGMVPNFDFMKRHFEGDLTEKGYINVNNFLQLENHENIFVAGDIVNNKEEKIAQNAESHAETIAHNIKSLENKKNLKEYESKKKAMVISLGKYNGILEYKNFVWGGIIPAILKFFIEKNTMRNYS